MPFQEGQQLIQEKPELSPVVRKKLEEIRECWQDLESTTQAKARQLFEANKADLLVQSYESLDQRLGQLEGQLVYVDQGQDLTSVNKQLKKLQVGTAFFHPLVSAFFGSSAVLHFVFGGSQENLKITENLLQ